MGMSLSPADSQMLLLAAKKTTISKKIKDQKCGWTSGKYMCGFQNLFRNLKW